jgi:hypothetical protein
MWVQTDMQQLISQIVLLILVNWQLAAWHSSDWQLAAWHSSELATCCMAF